MRRSSKAFGHLVRHECPIFGQIDTGPVQILDMSTEKCPTLSRSWTELSSLSFDSCLYLKEIGVDWLEGAVDL